MLLNMALFRGTIFEIRFVEALPNRNSMTTSIASCWVGKHSYCKFQNRNLGTSRASQNFEHRPTQPSHGWPSVRFELLLSKAAVLIPHRHVPQPTSDPGRQTLEHKLDGTHADPQHIANVFAFIGWNDNSSEWQLFSKKTCCNL